MKTFNKTFLIILLIAVFFSCDNDNDPTNNVCEEDFGTAIMLTTFSAANGYDELEFMDLRIHEYSVEIFADGEICTVGYQNGSNYTGSYKIEIINATTGNSYVGTHTFSQVQLEYQTITPLVVNNGDHITVRREVLVGDYTNLNELIGKVFRRADFSNVAYPVTTIGGLATFIVADFYGAGGPVPNIAQPKIPLGFKLN